jgi:hypothetical protein
VRAAADAGVDVRARPAPNVVGGEWGHVSSLRDVGCSELGDDLKMTWPMTAGPPGVRRSTVRLIDGDPILPLT